MRAERQRPDDRPAARPHPQQCIAAPTRSTWFVVGVALVGASVLAGCHGCGSGAPRPSLSDRPTATSTVPSPPATPGPPSPPAAREQTTREPAVPGTAPGEVPPPAAAQLTLTLSTGFMPDPEVVDGTVRAMRPASELSPRCAGFTTAEPAVALVLGTALGAEARVGVRGKGFPGDPLADGGPRPGPLGLAMVDPAGRVRCARASTEDGLATMAGPLEPGRYSLFVLAPAQEVPLHYALGVTEEGDSGLDAL